MSDLLRRMLFLPEEASTYAAQVDRLHLFIISTAMVVAAAIAAVTLVFYVRYRRREPEQATPVVEPRAVHEALFVAVPLGFFLLWFFIGFPYYVQLQSPPENVMDVYVQAKQWMWKFAYPGGPSSLDVLRVPAGRPVRLLLTSRDVIHSFFVPAFRLKQDVLPGRYTQTWFQATRDGAYPVFCAEYCGLAHSRMRAQVVVMPPESFDAWLAEQRRHLPEHQDGAPVSQEAVDPRSSLVQQGRAVAAEKGCLKCHSLDGEAHIAPTWLDLYGKSERLQDGSTVVANEAYLTESMMLPNAKVVAGYPPIMPTFQGRMTPAEVAAVLEFIKSLRTDAVRVGPSRGPAYGPIPGR